jgi:hypothetical protein
LTAYDVVYDPDDALHIILTLANSPEGEKIGLNRPANELLPELESKYGRSIRQLAVSLLFLYCLFIIVTVEFVVVEGYKGAHRRCD